MSDKRYDQHGEMRLMAISQNWAMVRRPHRVPFTMPVKDWDALPTEPHPTPATERNEHE